MNTINLVIAMTKNVISKYLAIIALFTVSSCTYNQYTTVRGGNDDLYGGSREAVAVNSNRESTNYDPYRNPDYAEVPDQALEGTDQYYDENYVTARNVQRRVGADVGYNDGFVDGYYAGRNTGFNPGFYNSMYPMFGYGSRFSIGFRIGMGGMMGMSYSPFGMGYSPFGWNRWGYDPFFHNSMAWGGWGNPFYGGMGYYGGLGMMGMYNGFYGMPHWGSYYPIIVNNYGDSGARTRNYGIRESSSAINRSSIAGSGSRNSVGNAVNSRNTNATRNSYSNNNARDGYYARPRGGDVRTSTGVRSNTSGRTSTSNSGADYYSSPRANRSYGSTEGAVRSSGNTNRTYNNSGSTYNSSSRTYGSPSSSRSSGNTSTPSRSSGSSYSAPSRSSAPSYSAPTRSTPSYSAPSRSSAPSYSAPSRSSSGGGGGTTRGGR